MVQERLVSPVLDYIEQAGVRLFALAKAGAAIIKLILLNLPQCVFRATNRFQNTVYLIVNNLKAKILSKIAKLLMMLSDVFMAFLQNISLKNAPFL